VCHWDTAEASIGSKRGRLLQFQGQLAIISPMALGKPAFPATYLDYYETTTTGNFRFLIFLVLDSFQKIFSYSSLLPNFSALSLAQTGCIHL